jgi:hypothetical protein
VQRGLARDLFQQGALFGGEQLGVVVSNAITVTPSTRPASSRWGS